MVQTRVNRNKQVRVRGTGGVNEGYHQADGVTSGQELMQLLFDRALKIEPEADQDRIAEMVKNYFSDAANGFATEFTRYRQSLRERLCERDRAQKELKDAKNLILRMATLKDFRGFKASGIAGRGGNKIAVFDREKKLVLTFE